MRQMFFVFALGGIALANGCSSSDDDQVAEKSRTQFEPQPGESDPQAAAMGNSSPATTPVAGRTATPPLVSMNTETTSVRERIERWFSISNSVSIFQVGASQPFLAAGSSIETRYSLSHIENLKATSPQTITLPGGELGGLRQIEPHVPTLEGETLYVGFFREPPADYSLAFVARVHGDDVDVDGESFPLQSLRALSSGNVQ